MSAGIVTSLTRPWILNCISRRQRIDDIWQYIPSGSKKDVNLYICHPCMQSLCRALRKILITSVIFSRTVYLLQEFFFKFIVQTEWTYLQKINAEYCSTKSEIIVLLKQTNKQKSPSSHLSPVFIPSIVLSLSLVYLTLSWCIIDVSSLCPPAWWQTDYL